MDPPGSRGYKRYLEPESHNTVPSSSWYRFKKQIEQQERPNTCCDNPGYENLPFQVEHNVNHETVPVPLCDKNEVDEMLEFNKCDVSSLQDNGLAVSVIQSLAEEIEAIENGQRNMDKEVNENVPDFLMDDPEDGDCFVDALDDENYPSNEDEHGENLFQQGYSSLQEAINSESFKKPISQPVNKTVGEVVLMIMKFVLVHALSLTETTDLFQLVNSIFAEPFIPSTRYFIDKILYPKNTVTLYAICPRCGAGIGRFERKDHHVKCKICLEVVDVKDNAFKDFFVIMDVATPISNLIESNSEYYNNIVNHRVHQEGHISDIYDGRRYRALVERLNSTDRHSYATVTFNTDGAPLFESSTNSIWPIFLMVNEVPYQIRSKELILAGLWFGKEKPDMTVFLEPFVECMNRLSSEGVECTINGKKLRIKICTVICCVDAVARAPVQGFTQFNGSYGCGQCLHPGEWVRSNPSNSRSGNIKYTLQADVPARRNAKDTLKHMQEAVKYNKPVFGVKRPSQLINLVYYDIILGCVVDSLHCAAGVAKQFATMWFGNKNKPGLLSRCLVRDVDTLMSNIKAPHQVGRLARSLSEKEFWKAREWENWIMFYSMVVLPGILPDGFLMHWALFVEAFYLLSKAELEIREVQKAEELLREFVGKSEILYGKTAMTFNIHSLVHLAKSVADWGPLWCHNAYAFESGNGDLLKVIHAAKGVHNQICRRISFKYSFITLKDHVYPFASSVVKQYCNTLGSSIAKQTLRSIEIRYFGSVSRAPELWSRRLKLGEHGVSYKKMVKNSCLYISALRVNKRSDNSYAVLTDNSYVKIIQFIIDPASNQEYTIVSKVHTRNAYNTNYYTLQEIVVMNEEQSAILTDNISKICVHMVSDNKQYLCAVPNLYYY